MESIITQGHIKSSVSNGIGTISFFHPKSNSLPGKLLKELAEAITELGQNEETKVIILKSEGESAFCAGASFDELLSLEDAVSSKEFFMGFARVINAIRKAPKFVIGRVHGKAVGGGVGIASAVDYCMATDNSSVKLSELAVGIGPFVVGPAVERKVGSSAFISLTINAAEWRSAEWAKEKGLFMDVYSTVEELDEEVKKLSTTLAKSSPDAMRELKRIMWAGYENWDFLLEERAEISGRLILEDFAKQIISKFKGK